MIERSEQRLKITRRSLDLLELKIKDQNAIFCKQCHIFKKPLQVQILGKSYSIKQAKNVLAI